MPDCGECLWFDQCGQIMICEFWSPIEEREGILIENGKPAFTEQWLEYIEEDDL